jgi:hypothetical protein
MPLRYVHERCGCDSVCTVAKAYFHTSLYLDNRKQTSFYYYYKNAYNENEENEDNNKNSPDFQMVLA